jgi:hypothetical protein
LFFIQSAVYVGCTDGDQRPIRLAIGGLETLLEEDSELDPLEEHELAFAYNVEAQCHQMLGDAERAKEAYAKSIAEEPSEPRWYLNRAQFWDEHGRPDLALMDRRCAQELLNGEPGTPPRVREQKATPALPKPTRSAFDDESS